MFFQRPRSHSQLFQARSQTKDLASQPFAMRVSSNNNGMWNIGFRSRVPSLPARSPPFDHIDAFKKRCYRVCSSLRDARRFGPVRDLLENEVPQQPSAPKLAEDRPVADGPCGYLPAVSLLPGLAVNNQPQANTLPLVWVVLFLVGTASLCLWTGFFTTDDIGYLATVI